MQVFRILFAAAILVAVSSTSTLAVDPEPLLKTLQDVGPKGIGSRDAGAAWKELVQVEAAQLPVVLAALDDAGPLAANWIRTAVDAIAERHVQAGGKLPADALSAFLHEKQHNPRARRLAYEWIVRVDPTAADRLIPQMLDDPSLEMRRDAVAEVIAAAEAAQLDENTEAAVTRYRKALQAARDLDQVKLIAEALKKLDRPIDLSRHFGFVMDWKLLGPFPSSNNIGFATVYPPEEAVDLSASHTGSVGPITWFSHSTDDDYGNVDLNKAIGKHMGVAGYATAQFHSHRRQTVELRLGSPNAIKIWLNGKLLASAEAYHTAYDVNGVMDQYVGRGELVVGRNSILVKVCQSEMPHDWAQDWKFQLRVCDLLGGAILSTDRPPAGVAKRQADEKAATE